MTLFEYCLIAVGNRVIESGGGTLCPETLVQQDATCTNRKMLDPYRQTTAHHISPCCQVFVVLEDLFT